jgi:Ca-activated chloride channel family protein
VVQAVITVSREAVGQASLADVGSYNLLATGEVLRDDRLFENFRYRFNLPQEEVTGETIPLIIERALRPGSYRLIVKLEDLNSQKMGRIETLIEVPTLDHPVPAAAPTDPETRRLLEEAQATLSTTDSTIEIVPPRGELVTGLVRVDTLVTGSDIDSVVFDLGGRQRLIKREPPFSVELDMGNTPQLLTLTAIGLDAEDREVARDVIDLNSSPHRFDVTLIEPHPGGDYGEAVRAEARVDVPADQAVDRVEFRINDELAATVFQPPWVQQLRLPGDGRLAYVSAKAIQPDGNAVEDLVYVNAPDHLDEVDVQFVELYISVLDRAKRPILGLTEPELAVLEDGAVQTPIRFDEVRNLPIHAGILLDISASMEDRLELAQRAALAFFENAIQPMDRAALITFNDRPNLAVKFTNELRALAGGLAGLKAERGTALYDSLVFGLHYFNGIKGQRALVLLSDGEDEHSRFPFEDALEYARRAGVAIYTIGLDLAKRDARSKLERFAEETGGRAFFVDDAELLGQIYVTIQTELRSRYYLAYQSTNSSGTDSFRTVSVDVDIQGAEVKTLRGYYP